MSSECKGCEDHFCCIYLGQKTCPKHCRRQNCFYVRCQLHHSEIINPAVCCQRCDFSSECHNYKHIGRVANRTLFAMERICVEHCPTPDCPHKEVITFDIPGTPKYPSSPDCGRVLNNVNPTQKVDILEQGTVTSWLNNRETSVPGPLGSANMGSASPEPVNEAPTEYLLLKSHEEPEEAQDGQGAVVMAEANTDLVQNQLSELA